MCYCYCFIPAELAEALEGAFYTLYWHFIDQYHALDD